MDSQSIRNQLGIDSELNEKQHRINLEFKLLLELKIIPNKNSFDSALTQIFLDINLEFWKESI